MGKTVSGKGGKRPGAGRPKGRKDKATGEQLESLTELARKHTTVAIEALVEVASGGDSDAARVSAANALLDRGYGKPKQSVDHTSNNQTISGVLVVPADKTEEEWEEK